MKNDSEILIILTNVNLQNQNLSYMKDIIEKNTTLSANKCFMTKPMRSWQLRVVLIKAFKPVDKF